MLVCGSSSTVVNQTMQMSPRLADGRDGVNGVRGVRDHGDAVQNAGVDVTRWESADPME